MFFHLLQMKICFLSPRQSPHIKSLASFDQVVGPLFKFGRDNFPCSLPPVRSIDLSPHHFHLQIFLLELSLDLHQFTSHPLLLATSELEDQPLTFLDNRIDHTIDLFLNVFEVISQRTQQTVVKILHLFVYICDLGVDVPRKVL